VEQHAPAGRGEFTYVDISSIDRETKRIIDPKVLPVAKAPSRAKQVLKTGDILVSMTRPNLNAVAIVPPDLDGSIGSTGFHVLRGKEAESGFLFYAVQTPGFIDAMCKKVQGALYPAVRPRDISSFCLPPFSLSSQRRIVAEIEKQFTRLEAGGGGVAAGAGQPQTLPRRRPQSRLRRPPRPHRSRVNRKERKEHKDQTGFPLCVLCDLCG
jgi:type I restriction enzyme S subunit